ncbi:MAG: exonuclease subunit SbcD [Deltaproteobacteria bacterium]|jgi:exonuclease SbcD|nr:exonuclease subunit SbcD [Deltaproteobacteria bacterium]
MPLDFDDSEPAPESRPAPENDPETDPETGPRQKTLLFEGMSPHLTGRPLRLLHTSDWHLGRTLQKTKSRAAEHELFLDWLAETVEAENADVLLVSGDVFDNHSPPVSAQELYYGFLAKIAASERRPRVVITSGNHDSASFLGAPAELLKNLRVTVVSDPTDDPADELAIVRDDRGKPILIVCAVPFLKDRHVRESLEGETVQERDKKRGEGTLKHFATLAALAEEKRKSLGDPTIPIVAMGHLFARGGKVGVDDGTRDLYVGGESGINTRELPSVFDYAALGHLHGPQKAGRETVRYSGAPLPMSFAEAKSEKSVTGIILGEGKTTIVAIPIPAFQRLERIRGDLAAAKKRITELKKENVPVWVEIVRSGEGEVRGAKGELEELVRGSKVEILSAILENRRDPRFGGDGTASKPLKEYEVEDVFVKLLGENDVKEEEREELLLAFRETVRSLEEEEEEEREREKEKEKERAGKGEKEGEGKKEGEGEKGGMTAKTVGKARRRASKIPEKPGARGVFSANGNES